MSKLLGINNKSQNSDRKITPKKSVVVTKMTLKNRDRKWKRWKVFYSGTKKVGK